MKTLILAAGSPDYRNMAMTHTGSQLMAVVKGRPIIAWVVGDFLKHAEGAATILTRQDDVDLIAFLSQLYDHNPRITVSPQPVTPEDSILQSTLHGLTDIDSHSRTPVRIILGDTLIKNVPYGSTDAICTSVTHDLSEKWCLTKPDESGRIITFNDKIKGLNTSEYHTVAGRYEFADGFSFKTAVLEAIAGNKKELSAALTQYAKTRPFTAVQVEPHNWIDFGHLEGLAKANLGLTEARSFNSIHINTPVPVLTKRSSNVKKLEQEAYWYNNLPKNLQTLAPRVLEFRQVEGGAELDMEYYGYPTLAEKFVYAHLSGTFWQMVMESLFTLIGHFTKVPYSLQPNVIDNIYAGKTFNRLTQLCEQNSFWKDLLSLPEINFNGRKLAGLPQLENHIRMKSAQLAANGRGSLVHGDLCFNNILFDPATGVIKLIDPRGEFGEGISIYGDIRYDIAKLRHSFCGRYDHIVEGLFSLSHDISGTEVQLNFADHAVDYNEAMFDTLVIQNGYNPHDIRFIESLLFLSMLPLHNDSLQKQKAFFYQGLAKLNDSYQIQQEKVI